MAIQISKRVLQHKELKTHALLFWPDPAEPLQETWALMTHGYTSHKGSLLNWASRLAEQGVVTALFDLPGHLLGHFYEVEEFPAFAEGAHLLFAEALTGIREEFLDHYPLHENHLAPGALKLALMGHSLGGLLALKALAVPAFADFTKMAIGVGLGLGAIDKGHLFESPLYKSTLNLRSELISKALGPERLFPWIKEEKQKLAGLKGQTIHLITGLDDLVVGDDGAERLMALLALHNQVTLERPPRMGHHLPELAASFVKRHLKAQGYIA